MAVRLRFPRGGSFRVLRQFVRDGQPVDLTGATLSAFVKYSPEDADADAIASSDDATLTITTVNTLLGIVRLTIPAATSLSLSCALRYYWQIRADLTAGDICVPESCHGPVELTPFVDLNLPAYALTDTLEPDDLADLDAYMSSNFLQMRGDITSAALHRALVTAGHTPEVTADSPWVIATLESGIWTTWSLRPRGVGESDDGTTLRLPDDYNATTNDNIWVKSALG